MSGPAPSYVEPNPQAFYRMAYIARNLACGLYDLVLHEPCLSEYFYSNWPEAAGLTSGMGDLGTRFEALGDIAAKELAGKPLDAEDIYQITNCLGLAECMNVESNYSRPQGEMPKVPVIAAVSGAGGEVLEVGVGNVDRIYVAVPLEGSTEIAQGGVFSYYEFSQPRDQRLTDEEWRARLSSGEITLPSWAANFVLPGGSPTESLFFRMGDVYYITDAGDKLNVRDQPSTDGKIITTLSPDVYVEIVDGPVQANGYTWWKFKIYDWSSSEEKTGWAVENQEWYERSIP